MAKFRAWLGSLFRSRELAALREANRELQQEKLSLQDRLDAVYEDRAKLWQLVQSSIEGERTAYQMHVNAQWQRQSGTVPYPDAPHLPAHAVPKIQTGEPVGRRGRMLPSEMVAQATRDYLANKLPAQ